ncbi:MAG: hypothetical protein LBQ62_03790, partial [Candidatus Accumulibacter sp.]|nr:hypothetical protein [Accumulibacter sp.]
MAEMTQSKRRLDKRSAVRRKQPMGALNMARETRATTENRWPMAYRGMKSVEYRSPPPPVGEGARQAEEG